MVLVKSNSKTRQAKQRSIIKTRRLNLLIKAGAGSKRLKDSNIPNGSFVSKRKRNPFIPVKLYFLFKKNRDRIKFISHKNERSSFIPVKPIFLNNRNALGNQFTYSKAKLSLHPGRTYYCRSKEQCLREAIYFIE
jgi:hypothetical protein